MIKTKIEERKAGNTKRYYPVVLKPSFFTGEQVWKEFKNPYDNNKGLYLYFDYKIQAERFIESYLIDKGQCTKITHWYPDYEEGKK